MAAVCWHLGKASKEIQRIHEQLSTLDGCADENSFRLLWRANSLVQANGADPKAKELESQVKSLANLCVDQMQSLWQDKMTTKGLDMEAVRELVEFLSSKLIKGHEEQFADGAAPRAFDFNSDCCKPTAAELFSRAKQLKEPKKSILQALKSKLVPTCSKYVSAMSGTYRRAKMVSSINGLEFHARMSAVLEEYLFRFKYCSNVLANKGILLEEVAREVKRSSRVNRLRARQ